MNNLHIVIGKDGNAQVEFNAFLGPEQFESFLKPFDQIKDVYKEDLQKSLRVSLSSKHLEKTVLSKDERSNTVSFKFQWKNCVKKVDSKYRFYLRKADTIKKISHGIGILDALEIIIPTSTSPILIEPKPEKVSKDTLIWKKFDWSRDLKLELQE